MDVGYPDDICFAISRRLSLLRCVERWRGYDIGCFDDSPRLGCGFIQLWRTASARKKSARQGHRFDFYPCRYDIFVAWQPLIMNNSLSLWVAYSF